MTDDAITSDHDRIVEIHTLLREHLAPKVLDHETRIRKLERALWIAAGLAAAGGSAIGSYVGGVFGG
ncbi:hypothetical protein [Jiangella sp. DSM 45060]|uniref:hypothetical protein n=1 Tax=Jiangella sp. DSM 45060 TaxID=1798224 RepID=UPI00087B6ECE|nr:hypothetical protein [Jiangella sp. DSM 45060]SDT69409.1 hypothetical protein SAMN04515669_6017 [Jiangella sp. DSM 45060]